MKTIKSVLIGALVALLGSSAWAAINADKTSVTVEVGKSETVTLTNTSSSQKTLSMGRQSGGSNPYTGTGYTAKLSNTRINGNNGTVQLTITGTSVTSSDQTLNIYRTDQSTVARAITVKVTAPKPTVEEIDCGDVFISHGQTQILTNDQGQAILWGKVKEDSSSSSNEDIATLTSSNVNNVAYAAVNNPVRDGTAKLVVAIEGTNYNYTVHAMTVEIEKTVKAAIETDKNNRSNATIRVTTHVLYGVHEIPTNTIVFIGSTCASHGLGGSNKDTTTARNNTLGQINTIATKGRVKWYLYGNQSGQQATTTAKHSGTLDMEKELTSTDVPVTNYGSGRHRNLLAYLTCLDNELKDDHSGVDYIVLSFDGGRLAKQYRELTTDYSALEARVAKKLEWYYKNKRVIWIREAYPVTWDEDKYEQYGSEYYRPANTMDDEVMNQKQWEAMVAMLDPVTYNSKPSGSRYTATKSGTGEASGNTIYAATRNDIQTDYNSPDQVKAFLDANIKKATYDTELVDKVLNLNKSLSIVPTGSGTKQEVHFYTWAGKSAPVAPAGGVIADLPKNNTNWKAEPDSAFKVDGYQVTANVSNITMETWNMFEISIVDNGTFLQECLAHDPPLAKLDPETGKYTVDPNDGPAHVTLYSEEGGQKYEVQAAAKATSVLWPFDLIPLKIYVDDATVTYGDDVPTTLGWKSGAARYDLPNVDESKINGLNTVTFGTTYTQGDPVGSGYTINTNSAALSSTYYAITVVKGTLTVKPATIKPVKPGENPPEDGSPYTAAPCIEKTYDGEGTNITAEVFNVDDTTDVPTFLYSTTSENGPFVPWDQIEIRDVELDGEDVTSNKVWYTVTTKTAGGDENYFAATNFAWILIKPRPVTLTAASESWLYDGNEHKTNGWEVTSGSFVPGEGVDETHFSMTDESVIKDCGEVVNAIDEDKLQPLGGTSLDNYDITLDTGWLRVSGIDITATAEDVEITYDGTKTNITVKIGESYEPHGDFKIWYAYDKIEHIADEKRTFSMVRPADAPEDSAFTMDESPKFMDAGTNRVWFKVVDQNENYSNYYGSARIKILPRPVHFTFPKAVKPYDGTTTGVPLATNLIGEADNMVGAEWFDCTATGTFTSPNVGDDEDYFHLDNVTIDGKKNAFKRNYVITYDGEADQLVPGAITALPIEPAEPMDPGDNPDDEPDPTDDPTIWARNVVKCYDGIGTNVIAKVYNAVDGNTFTYEYSTNKIDFVAWEDLQFTNVVAEQKVWYRAMTAQGNYLGVTNFAYVTITPRQIQGIENEDEPWAQATSVECFIDEIPEGGSTNIIVTCGGFFGDDLNKTNVVYTTPGGWSEIGVYTNWCTVSCEPNYLSTNLMATVKIKEREGDVDGDTEPENAEEIAEEMKDVAKAAGEIIRETTGEDPIYVEVRLVVNSTNNLPQAEQERTAQDAKKLEEKFGKDYSDYENVKGECVDIKLELTTDPDRIDWMNIGSNNDVMVDIELTPDCALDEIVAIYRCHYSGSTVSYNKIVESASKPSKTSTEERWWRNRSKGVVHLHVKKFSLFEIFTGDKVTPPPPPPPPPAPVVVDPGSQVADYRATIRYVDMTRWTRPLNGIYPFVKVARVTLVRGYVVYNNCACGERATGMVANTIAPAFLVVKSFVQTDDIPKILPADLLVRVIDNSIGLRDAEDEIGAEGYLFAGAGKGSAETGGNAKGVAPWMMNRGYGFGSMTTSTRLLFGKYNDAHPGAFVDAWLDHAGFGSAVYEETEGGCSEDSSGTCLRKLIGYLIGGSYLCRPNGSPLAGFDWFPCHEWIGTTDVLTGYWGMKRVVAEKGTLTSADGAIWRAFQTSGKEVSSKEMIMGALGQVKACVNRMTNGKRPNLSFITDENTVMKLTRGFEYEAE